jgi:hypothetical protein
MARVQPVSQIKQAIMTILSIIFKVCEEFKNNTTYLTRCGIYLYGNHPNFIVKHYGLQLIQHAIK